MIEITLYKQRENLLGIESKGHSGAGTKGNDIICAAVSVLMQSLMLGLMEVVKLETAAYYTDDKKPLIRITWNEREINKAHDLAETVAKSLECIAKDNPKHVKVHSHSTEEINNDIPF